MICVTRAQAQARLNELLDAGAAFDDPRVVQARNASEATRGHYEFQYGAKKWKDKDRKPVQRRIIARIQATPMGLDVRYVATNIKGGTPEYMYETLYCARGQMENLIKLHKTQLRSDRTSCSDPVANQIRLIFHTVAYWLIHTVRAKIPAAQALAKAEFKTIQQTIIKIAARVVEYGTRIRVSFDSLCPNARLFSGLVRRFFPSTA